MAENEADARLDRYLDNYLEAAMDLPRLGEPVSPGDLDPMASPGSPSLPFQPTQRSPEPLPAWLRGDEQSLSQDDFDDFGADDAATTSIGLRGLRWIRKNMSSFKVTVSLQRPLPPTSTGGRRKDT